MRYFKLFLLVMCILNLTWIKAEETNTVEVYGDIKACLSIVFPDGYKIKYFLDTGSLIKVFFTKS